MSWLKAGADEAFLTPCVLNPDCARCRKVGYRYVLGSRITRARYLFTSWLYLRIQQLVRRELTLARRNVRVQGS